jgi:hypothetical protein
LELGGWRRLDCGPHTSVVEGGDKRGAKRSVHLSCRGEMRRKILKCQKMLRNPWIEKFACLRVKFWKACELDVISSEACKLRVIFQNLSSSRRQPRAAARDISASLLLTLSARVIEEVNTRFVATGSLRSGREEADAGVLRRRTLGEVVASSLRSGHRGGRNRV